MRSAQAKDQPPGLSVSAQQSNFRRRLDELDREVYQAVHGEGSKSAEDLVREAEASKGMRDARPKQPSAGRGTEQGGAGLMESGAHSASASALQDLLGAERDTLASLTRRQSSTAIRWVWCALDPLLWSVRPSVCACFVSVW